MISQNSTLKFDIINIYYCVKKAKELGDTPWDIRPCVTHCRFSADFFLHDRLKKPVTQPAIADKKRAPAYRF